MRLKSELEENSVRLQGLLKGIFDGISGELRARVEEVLAFHVLFESESRRGDKIKQRSSRCVRMLRISEEFLFKFSPLKIFKDL